MQKTINLLTFASLILTFSLFYACSSEDTCDMTNCLNGGVCNDGNCDCPAGFTGDNCETAIDLCDGVLCENGGTCVNGSCDCPPGFSGDNCEIANTVQARLDAGNITPLALVNEGIPADSLYGKLYEGGLIFYLDLNDDLPSMEGLIVAANSLNDGNTVQFGCNGLDISGLENITDFPSSPENETTPTTRIGDGLENTTIIAAECTEMGAVANLCLDYEVNGKADWYLPSRGELFQIYQNLYLNDLGEFSGSLRYWSSTENAFNRMWVHTFNTGVQNIDFKASTLVQIRPVRSF